MGSDSMVCAFFRVAKPMNPEKWDWLPFTIRVVMPDIGMKYPYGACIPKGMVSWAVGTITSMDHNITVC